MLFDDAAICLAGELRLASKRQAETDAKKIKRTASTQVSTSGMTRATNIAPAISAKDVAAAILLAKPTLAPSSSNNALASPLITLHHTLTHDLLFGKCVES